MKNRYLTLTLGVLIGLALIAVPTSTAQNAPLSNATAVQPTISLYFMTPISATAAVNNQTTLTIPAPSAGLYNYVCKLAFVISQDGTATANTNVVTTSTNFNSFALKKSLAATANLSTEVSLDFGSPATGCAKSTSPGTATTFVSPAAAANTAYSWYAAYFQAP